MNALGPLPQTPDQTFAGCVTQAGTTAARVTVAANTSYLRSQYNLATDDDINLYLCKGPDVVASSTAGGTNELIELSSPEAGDYTLYVHGWQVVTSPLAFSIDQWQAVRDPGGSLKVKVDSTSTTVTTGDTVNVTASWTGAPTGVSYGVVDHTKDGHTYGQTIVQVNN
jgi:hypothetical protein